MTPIKRIYNTKDVDMLLAVDTIMDSAIANKVFLQKKRSTWQDPYFENTKKKIDDVIQKHLGIDNAKKLRQATDIVKSIQSSALLELAEIKVQIEQDFKATPDRKEEILNQLGFTTYFSSASESRDQEALINLLYQYKANLTTELKNEIVLKGTAADALNNINQYSDSLKNADVTQEGTKGAKKETTEEAIQAFNEIYSIVSSIAIIAAKFYKGDTTKKELFSFNKVSKEINNPGPKKPKIV